jgi:hypothetical protein
MSISMCYVWVEVCRNLTTYSSTNSDSQVLFYVLGVYILCFLFVSFYIPIAEVSVSEGLLGGICDGKFYAPGSFLPCLWLLVCPDTDNSQKSSGVVARIIRDFVHIS